MPKIRKVSHAFPLIDSPDPARTTETLNGMDHENDDAELVDSLWLNIDAKQRHLFVPRGPFWILILISSESLYI